MEGGIGAYNNTGRGATFYLELPFLDINEKRRSHEIATKKNLPLRAQSKIRPSIVPGRPCLS